MPTSTLPHTAVTSGSPKCATKRSMAPGMIDRVGIHRDHDLALRHGEACVGRVRLAAVGLAAAGERAVVLRPLALHHLGRVVGRAVVDDEDLELLVAAC